MLRGNLIEAAFFALQIDELGKGTEVQKGTEVRKGTKVHDGTAFVGMVFENLIC